MLQLSPWNQDGAVSKGGWQCAPTVLCHLPWWQLMPWQMPSWVWVVRYDFCKHHIYTCPQNSGFSSKPKWAGFPWDVWKRIKNYWVNKVCDCPNRRLAPSGHLMAPVAYCWHIEERSHRNTGIFSSSETQENWCWKKYPQSCWSESRQTIQNPLGWKLLLKVIWSNTLKCAGMSSTTWGCSELCLTWPWMFLGMEHLHSLWVTCSGVLSVS